MNDPRLEATRIRALYRLARPAYATTVGLGGLLCVALWDSYPAAVLLWWLAALTLVTLARVAIHWRYAAVRRRPEEAPAWEDRFALGSFASGAVWALAAFVLIPGAGAVQQVIVVLMCGGVLAGVAGLYAPSSKAVYAFGLLPLVSTVGVLAFHAVPGYRPLALAVLVYGALMARMSSQIRGGIVETIGARLSNEALLERVRESETVLRDAVDSFPEGIAVWSADNRLLVCNEPYVRLYGGAHPAAGHGGEPRQYRIAAGRWLRESSRRMAGGGWVALAADITDLKSAQEKYLAVLAEENLMLDTLPIGVAFVERRTIVRCNPRLEQMLGYSQGQLAGKSTRVLYGSDEAWDTAGEAYARLAGGAIFEGDMPMRRRDGSSLWCRLLVRTLDPADPQASAIVTFSDITERHRPEVALRASEQTYRNLVETSSELIWSLDAGLRWTYLNAAGAGGVYGCEPAELLGQPFFERVALELRERDRAVFPRVLAGESVFGHESRHVRRDGSFVDLSFNAIPLRGPRGDIVGVTGTARDITEQKRAAAALHESVERLRLAVDAADLYHWEWDAQSDALHWGRVPEIVGRLGGARTWTELVALVHPDDRERYDAAGRAAVERAEALEIEYRLRGAEGRAAWLGSRGVPVRDSGGRVLRIIGVSQDITERKRREDEVCFLAYHDSLTSLPNRRLLDDRLQQAIFQAQRHDGRVAAMLVDLDNFKQVNDTAGHRAGDAVLREVAERLSGCVRRADTLARHGGDEFVIVLAGLQVERDCQVVAEKVLRELGTGFQVEGSTFMLGASIGISIFPSDAADGDTLLRNADAAMYRAKQLGKNQFRFYGK
jgi:diguanylate cyclase (GGDEF)-like protein/PAS domain S-box-containing protein